MENPRIYGNAPYDVAVVHGGPGAPGEMAPVARELAREHGVLEPLQTQASLAGQLVELGTLLENTGSLPLTLVGYSWGAILSFMFAAENPDAVKKLILVSSGVFSDEFVERIKTNRRRRLSERERAHMEELIEAMNDPEVEDKDMPFAELGELIAKADAYDPLPHDNDIVAFQHDIFAAVWADAEAVRAGGVLLEMGRRITCPVVAIHGDFDPHPWEGIRMPLAGVLRDFRFVMLDKCGHHPWYERHAREAFYEVLRMELD
ncbi:MAG: alpha/beta hydrolase [Actinobacteria bacterium]|nr:alpha/beta hydrolase [Actinomycetota bacterium]